MSQHRLLHGGLSVVGGIVTLYVATDGDDDTGNGTVDLPYLTIAKAVTMAPTSGTIINIADGTYTLTDAVAANKAKLQFVGASRVGVIVEAPLSNAPGFAVTADDVQFKTLTIDGRIAAGGTGSGITVVAAQRCVIDDCLVMNTGAQGIRVSGNPRSDYGVLKNSTISNLGITKATAGAYTAGIQIISGGDDWIIYNNTFTGWSQAIGLWYGCNRCEVSYNTLIDNYGYANAGHTTPRSALEVYPETTVGGHHHIHHNTIDGSTSCCIESAQGDDSTLYEYNTLINWTSSPVAFADGGETQKHQNVVFTHNTLTASGSNGSAALGGRNLTYTYNDHHDFTNAAYEFPLVISAAFDTKIVTHNTFDNCRGMVLASANCGNAHIITDNVLTNPAGATGGNLIRVDAGNGHTISRNVSQTAGAANVGIHITGGTGHTIQDNNLHCHSRCLYIATANNVVGESGHGNTFVSDASVSVYAIQCYSASATGNVITYNTVDAVDNWGCMGFISGATGNTFIHNTILHGAITAGTGNTTTPNP
jgi:hypothetical protein